MLGVSSLSHVLHGLCSRPTTIDPEVGRNTHVRRPSDGRCRPGFVAPWVTWNICVQFWDRASSLRRTPCRWATAGAPFARTRKRVRKRPPLRLKCVKGIHIYEDMDWLSRCTVSIPDISMQIVLIIYIYIEYTNCPGM